MCVWEDTIQPVAFVVSAGFMGFHHLAYLGGDVDCYIADPLGKLFAI